MIEPPPVGEDGEGVLPFEPEDRDPGISGDHQDLIALSEGDIPDSPSGQPLPRAEHPPLPSGGVEDRQTVLFPEEDVFPLVVREGTDHIDPIGEVLPLVVVEREAVVVVAELQRPLEVPQVQLSGESPDDVIVRHCLEGAVIPDCRAIGRPEEVEAQGQEIRRADFDQESGEAPLIVGHAP